MGLGLGLVLVLVLVLVLGLVLGLGLGLTKTRGMQPVRASSPPGWAQLALTMPVQGGWGWVQRGMYARVCGFE